MSLLSPPTEVLTFFNTPSPWTAVAVLSSLACEADSLPPPQKDVIYGDVPFAKSV